MGTQATWLSRDKLSEHARTFVEDRTRRLVAAFFVYLLATVAWLWPMVKALQTTVLRGPADSTLSIRAYWAVDAQGGTPFSFDQDYLNGAPEGIPWHDAIAIAQPIQSFVTWGLHPLVGFIGGFNVFLILGFVLTGFFGFALLDRLEMHPLVSFFGGYVLAFNPWMFERAFAGHAAFNHVWIYLALILALLRMSERRTISSAALAGLCFGGTFLFSSYFGLLGSVVVAVYFLFELVRVHGWAEKLWTVTLSCATLAVTVLCILPGAIAYRLDQESISSTITNATLELQRLGAETDSYLLPSRNHPAFGAITRSIGASANFAEQTLFFGWTTIVLAAVGIYFLIRRHPTVLAPVTRRHALVFAAILLPVAYWSSLRRVVHVFGVPLPGLSWFLGEVTTYYRVYARFGVIVGIALVMLAAPALDRLVRRSRGGMLAGCALLVLVAFELLPGRVTAWADASNPPVYDRWLADQPRGIVAHYPLPTDQEPAIHLGEREIYYQMFHGQPLFNIFGAGTGNTREDSIRILGRYITDPLTPGILKAEGVRYVFVHDDVYREQKQEPPDVPAAFVPIRSFPNVRVYRLADDVAPVNLDEVLEQNAAAIAAVQGLPAPEVTFASGFSEPFRQEGTSGWRRLEGAGTIELEHDDPILKRSQIVFSARSEDIPRVIRFVDARGERIGQFIVPTALTQYVVGPIRTPSGRTRITVESEPAGTRLGGIVVGPPTPQPVSDFSLSLRAAE